LKFFHYVTPAVEILFAYEGFCFDTVLDRCPGAEQPREIRATIQCHHRRTVIWGNLHASLVDSHFIHPSNLPNSLDYNRDLIIYFDRVIPPGGTKGRSAQCSRIRSHEAHNILRGPYPGHNPQLSPPTQPNTNFPVASQSGRGNIAPPAQRPRRFLFFLLIFFTHISSVLMLTALLLHRTQA
jgi:hypothetical protein